jgi:hypothetical protein
MSADGLLKLGVLSRYRSFQKVHLVILFDFHCITLSASFHKYGHVFIVLPWIYFRPDYRIKTSNDNYLQIYFLFFGLSRNLRAFSDGDETKVQKGTTDER